MRTLRSPRSKAAMFAAVILALAASALAQSSAADAQSVTVCASGCNYTTIAGALASAVSGETINILDAVHNEANLTIDGGLTLTIQGKDPISTVIDGGNAGPVFTINSGTVTIQNLTVRNGLNGADGGGIINWDALTLKNCVVSGNTSGANGGGLVNFGGVVAISDCTVSGNTAASFGGGVLNTSFGTLTINRSTLSDNLATNDGGGLANASGSVTVLNSTFSGNSATLGGGVENFDTLAISSSTIADNTASASGGGIDNGGVATVKNSIVGDNNSDCSGTLTALGANLDTDASCANFAQVASTELGLTSLALNPPGSTETFALVPGSAAIDKATDCTDVTGNPVTTDQRGVSRPQGLACDIGAFEAQPQAISAVTNQIDYGLADDPYDTSAGSRVTMGAFVHEKATVTTTVDPIPSRSSLTLNAFSGNDCSPTPGASEIVNLNGGAMTESAESSGSAGVAAEGPLPVGAVAYNAVFKSGNTLVPDATSPCAALNVISPISQFSYTVNGDASVYNCTLESIAGGACPSGTQEASVAPGSTNSYLVTIALTNLTGLTVSENVSGSFVAGKGVSIGNPTLTPGCGDAVIKHNGQVQWNANGSNSPKAAGFTMMPGQNCALQVTVSAAFGAGQQAITGQWSATQNELSPLTNQNLTLKSPLTGSLAVNVN